MEDDSSTENFEFAFDDIDFSDRVLHVQITPDEDSSTPKLKKLKYSLTNSPPPVQTDVSDSCPEFQLKSLHLSSAILAAKSPFFYKLFKNGMSESQQKEATLRIHSSEETALMDLLKFMYINTLSATTLSDLLDVLMAADKFQVKSCIKHCVVLLSEKPMSLESALLYLEIPSTVLAIQSLKEKSKQYIVAHFQDFEKSKEEAMKLSLDALKIVLGSECLRVNSEDNVYDFILEWARAHYPKLEVRKEILKNQLVQFISFPYLSSCSLEEVLDCPDFSSDEISKLVMNSLFHKARVSSKYYSTTKTRRIYNLRLVKVVPVEFSLPRGIIYFNLKKEDCRALFPSEVIISETFHVGSHWFYIGAECKNDQLNLDHAFGVFVMFDADSETCKCTLDVGWAVMKKPSNEYEIQDQEKNCDVTEGEGFGWWDLFAVPWATFISDESKYFIDDVLHLRAELTITKSQP